MPVYKTEKRTKDGRQYYFVVSYKDLKENNKQYKSKKFLTKKEATLKEAEFMATIGINRSNSLTFNDIAIEFLQYKSERVKIQTLPKIRILLNHIIGNLGEIEINKLNISQYQQFKNYLNDKGFSADYKNKIHTLVKALITFAFKRYGCVNNIPDIVGGFVEKEKPVKKINYYTLEEFNQFIKEVDDIRFSTLFITLYYMGLRIGEANSLSWKDIDFDKNMIEISKTVTTKLKGQDYYISSPKTKGSIRSLPMPKIVSKSLLGLKEYYTKFDYFNLDWFVFGGIRPLPDTTITKKKDDTIKKTNLHHIRIHDLRHSCASLLINNNANITVVAKFLGHTDIAMTLNTYSHFYKNKLDEIVNLINEMT